MALWIVIALLLVITAQLSVAIRLLRLQTKTLISASDLNLNAHAKMLSEAAHFHDMIEKSTRGLRL